MRPHGDRRPALWHDDAPRERPSRPPVDGELDCDVAIVGAGFTGLWTAYYLRRLDPGLRIRVLERERVAFGASGRNGGWVQDGMVGSPAAYGIGAAAAERAEAVTRDAVDEVGRVVRRESIDCGFAKRGSLTVATTSPQWARLQARVAARSGRSRTALLSAGEARELVDVDGVVGAAFDPDAARVHPARLAEGVAAACERQGVVIHEGTAAAAIAPRRVVCDGGVVRAEHVIRATEAYTTQLRDHHRRFLPLYSLMIATEPLSEAVWRSLRWPDGLLINDSRHLFFYAQRTPCGRIALGGRGAPYRLRHPISVRSEYDPAVSRRLREALAASFPAAAAARITHGWGGPIAVSRDWCMSIDHDRGSGLGSAGGYAGHGVALANVAGRTLADLVTGRASELTTLPWVRHPVPGWEPEPLRYLASRAIVSLLGHADRREDRSGRTSRVVRPIRRLLPQP